jgi:hypothetical protein
MPGTSGIMLCGVSQSWQSNFLAEIIGLSGLGGSRASVDVSTNADAGGWGRRILSCLRRSKPFRATIAFQSNKDWATILGSAFTTWTITWPIESGYSSAATFSMSVGMTDFTFGGMLEDRMLAEVELTPTGAPTITPGS